jgi:phosphoribosylanthranilate isomerase
VTLVKICGITNVMDAKLAAESGADFLGFVFYPQSPRYVSAAQVREIVNKMATSLDGPMPHLVGVFVDETPQNVSRTLDFCGLEYAQLHGSESPEMTKALIQQGFKVIKAFRVRDETFLEQLADYVPDAFLLDTFVPGRPGGTGHAFDWELAVRAKEFGRVVLAGGLTPDNVAGAIAAVGPWAIDVSSGVEEEPGRKDQDKTIRFINAVKSS